MCLVLDYYQEPCDADCVCIPKGNCYQRRFSIVFDDGLGHHDYDYFLTVTVKNNAELTSSRTMKVNIIVKTWKSYQDSNVQMHVSKRELLLYNYSDAE